MKPRNHLFVVAIAIVSNVARAEPNGAQAEILFRNGIDLLAKGDIAEACAAFDASQKLEPTTGTLLRLADCREKNGQLATAWGLFLEAERKTRASTDESTKKLHKAAVDHAAKLEPQLSTLAINVTDEARVGGLEIRRGSDVVEPVMWNKVMPIDGGTYRISARAPGNAEWSTTITIANDRDAKIVAIPRLVNADLGKATAPPREPSMQHEPARTLEQPRVDSAAPRRPARWQPYAVGGAGVALLGGALALELTSESTYDRAKRALDPAQQDSLFHRANAQRYAAEGLAVAGVAATGTAVWLYIRGRRATRSTVAVAPAVGGGHVGIQLSGGF
jgi:hypothetical protein